MSALRKVTLSLAMAAMVSSAAFAGDTHITLASTTSTDQSGLFSHIIPQFREATGIDVRVVAVGTGQAFEIARRGDADALLVHDAEGEEQFVANGHASERRDVMYNDFVIIGPADDPAGVRDASTASEAMQRIAAHLAPFTSRGDDSGTHRAERRLWEQAGIEPGGSWYRQLGSGMGPTLNTAAAMDAYVMADRGTWVAFDNRQGLEILLEGDDVLFNQYGSLLLNFERHPHLKREAATRWHEWLVSDEGQAAIASYQLRGEQLFFPNAE